MLAFFFPHHSSLLLKTGSSSDPRQSAFMPGSFGRTWSHICPVDPLSGLCLSSLDPELHMQVLEGHFLLCTLMTFFVPRPKHRNTLLSALRPPQSQVQEATSPLDSFLNIPLHLSFTFLVLGPSWNAGSGALWGLDCLHNMTAGCALLSLDSGLTVSRARGCSCVQ